MDKHTHIEYKYFLTFIDDYSWYTKVYLLKHKFEFFEQFWIYKIESYLGMKYSMKYLFNRGLFRQVMIMICSLDFHDLILWQSLFPLLHLFLQFQHKFLKFQLLILQSTTIHNSIVQHQSLLIAMNTIHLTTHLKWKIYNGRIKGSKYWQY